MLDIQGIKDGLFDDNANLSKTNNIYLRSIITSKLDSSIHANIITPNNKGDAKLIWKAIIKFFASSDASNQARVFENLQNLVFNPCDIQGFINSAKIAIRRLHKVGIKIPTNIIAYMLIHKLPGSMSNIKDCIIHNQNLVNPDTVLEHIQIHFNNVKIKE